MQPTRWTLANGLEVVCDHRLQARAVAATLWLRIGSRHESEAEQGLAHFLEHMVFRGTRRRPSSLLTSIEVERVGGDLNAETDREMTGYTVLVPANHWKLGLDVLFDLVVRPLLRDEDMELERQIILEELRSLEDEPADHVIDLAGQALWSRHRLGREVLGREETVSSFSGETIRNFHRRHYRPDRMVLSVVGRLSPEELSEWLLDWVAPLLPAPGAPLFVERQPPDLPIRRIHLESRTTRETHLSLAVATRPLEHPDRWALALLRVILGGGSSSRLFQEVRERRGLAYDISVDSERHPEAGALFITASTRPRKAGEVLTVVLDELERCRSGQLTEVELSFARDHYLGRLSLNLDQLVFVASWLGGSLLLEGTIPEPDAIERAVRAVDLAQLKRVSEEVFVLERMALAVIGPHHSTARFQRAFVGVSDRRVGLAGKMVRLGSA